MAKSVVFFGSSAYSIPALQTLLDHHISVVQVITTPDQPAGRHLKLTPNPLKQFAQIQSLKMEEDFSQIPPLAIGLVAAYGKIIPPSVLDKFSNQIYNIHPSLLPKYRGASPLQFQILAGETVTGVTVFQLDAQIDHGPIVVQETDQILSTDTPETLGKRLFVKGTELFIKNVLDTKNLNLSIQDDSQSTSTRKLSRQDGFIPYAQFQDQIQHPSPEFERKFRAFYPWPGLWTTNPQGEHLKLLQLSPLRISP